jgi:cytidine deaminase
MSHSDLIEEAQRCVGEFALSEPWLSAGSVGCALETRGGHLFTGICVDLACGVGFYAEHAAVAAMLGRRETTSRAL